LHPVHTVPSSILYITTHHVLLVAVNHLSDNLLIKSQYTSNCPPRSDCLELWIKCTFRKYLWV